MNKQQKLMNSIVEDLKDSDVERYLNLLEKDDITNEDDIPEMVDEDEEDVIYEEDKYDPAKGPGGIKLTKEQLNNAAKMLAETYEYLVRKNGDITFADINAFPQDKETIKQILKARNAIQKSRIRVYNQLIAVTRMAAYHGQVRHPVALMAAYYHLRNAEDIMDKNLKQYASMSPVGVWALSICGIGPVFAASLVAYFDLGDRKYPGQFWSYAGISGNPDWDIRKKGSKVKYNPDLKTLCFKISGSFMKMKWRDECYYGHIIDEMIGVYNKRNEEGGFKDNAKFYLNLKKWNPKKQTYKTYSEGKLPKMHIIMMARRYAVKRFIAHLFEAFWYSEHYFDGLKDKCPNPYVEDHLGHHDIVHAPNLEIIDQWYANSKEYRNLIPSIESKVLTEDKTVDEVIKPSNKVEDIIVDVCKKTFTNNHDLKMRVKATKVGSKED